MGRHSCCTKQKLRKGLWSPEEDEKLYNYITRNGVGCWSSIPKQAGLQRCGKSCRLRWINYLRPDLKRGMFSQHEEELIINLHKALGNRWAQIATQLPGRTDNEIKNLWNSCLKKKLMKQGIDPKTHKQLNEPRHEQNCATTTTTTRTQNSAAANTDPTLHQQLQRSTNNQEQDAAPLLVPPPPATWSAIKTEFCPTSCNNNNNTTTTTDIGLIQSGHGFFSRPVFDSSISSTSSAPSHIFQPGFDNFLINNYYCPSSILLDQYHQNSDHQTANFHQQEAAGGGAELFYAHNCDHQFNLPNLITTTTASSNHLGETDISSDSCSTQGGGKGVRSNSFLFNDEVKESSTSSSSTTTTNLDTTAVLSWENNNNKLECMLETYTTHDYRHDGIKMEEEDKLNIISPWQQQQQQIHYGHGDQFRSSSCPLKSFSEDLYGLNFDIFQHI